MKLHSKQMRTLLVPIYLWCVTGIVFSQPPGSLDPTFGNGGIVTTENGTISNSQSLVIQIDGKVVISGNALFGGGSVGFGLARYNTDGSLDNSFSNDGVLTSIPLNTNNDWVSSMALQSDQKIIVAGGTQLDGSDVESGWAFRLSRYNSDGTLDPSFGSSGNVITILEPTNIACWIDNISSIAIQADGKIVAVGTSCLIGGFTIVRYNPNGTIDGSFGINGIVTTQTTDHLGPGADAVGIHADGKIVVAGVQRSGENLVVVARYHPSGSLDGSFDGDGKAGFRFGPLYNGVTTLSIQPDERILIGGSSGDPSALQFAVARLNPDGSKDVTFGENGIVLTQFGADARLFALAIQSDGKIIASGSSLVIGTAQYSVGLIRYDTAGRVDASYGNLGKTLIDFGSPGDGTDVVVDSVGRAVVSGSIENRFAVARLTGGNAVPQLVAVAGRVTTAGGRGVQNARVTITDSLGATRTGTTSTFGYYQFDNIITGQTYTIGAASKRYSFLDRAVQVNDNLSDVDFVAIDKSTVRGE